MRLIKPGIVLIIITLCLFACDRNRLFEDYYTTGSTGWNKDSVACFLFDIDNQAQSYNLLINTRNLESYPFNNLWLFVDVIAPDSTILRDTVECQLAFPNGKWMGKGTSGIYENKFSYRKNIFFPVKGAYQINIKQGMRDDELKGLNDIGIRVEKTKY